MAPLSLLPLPIRRRLPILALAAGLVALAGCSPVGVLNTLARAGEDVVLDADVAYGPGARQRLDVYRPSSAAPAGGWPVVVFFHGGSWSSGDRAMYRFVGTALARRGVLALVADYRLHPEARYPDFLEDGARALAWGLEHARRLGGDPARVYAMGHSAGGYNAAMLALDRRWLAATGHAPRELAGWIGLAGPYDFFPSSDPELQAIFHAPDYPAGGQPIEHVRDGAAPRTFLATGAHDTVVSPARSTLALAAGLRAAGVDVTLRIYERPSHVTLIGAFAAPLRWLAPVLDDTVAFVDGPARSPGPAGAAATGGADAATPGSPRP